LNWREIWFRIWSLQALQFIIEKQHFMRKLNVIVLSAAFIVAMFGCNNSSKKEMEGFKYDAAQKKKDIEVTKSLIYLFPAPGEILERFQEADLSYIEGIIHDPSLVDQYLTTRDKALNLGVYLTDLAYTSLFTRSNEAADYMNAIQALITDLNISTATFESLIGRAKANLGNTDSMTVISNEVFFNTVEYLESSGRENTIAIISSGAYVESMYLALHAVEDYDADDPIIEQIAELKYPMDNLMSHIETVSDDPNVQSIVEYINDLNAIFETLEEEVSEAKKDGPGVISFSGGSAPDLTEDNFDDIKSTVESVREVIVGVK